MPGSQLKRVEKSIQMMRDNPDHKRSTETAEALEDLVNAVKAVERRLGALENCRQTKAIDLPKHD